MITYTDADLIAQASKRLGRQDIEILYDAVLGVWAMVHGYTRGRGFSVVNGSEEVAADLAAVIVAAACRVAVNPEQVERYQVADYAETPARFLGFNLAEQSVLNRYRKRAL